MLGSRILLILVRAGLLIGLVTALWATVTGIWWLISPSAFAPEGATIIGSPRCGGCHGRRGQRRPGRPPHLAAEGEFPPQADPLKRETAGATAAHTSASGFRGRMAA